MNLLSKFFGWLSILHKRAKTTQNKKTLKEKGDQFEQFVVKKFDQRYFTLKEWRSDKGINGRYAESNKNPDLEFEFHLKGVKTTFAVECKWRKNYYKLSFAFSYPSSSHYSWLCSNMPAKYLYQRSVEMSTHSPRSSCARHWFSR